MNLPLKIHENNKKNSLDQEKMENTYSYWFSFLFMTCSEHDSLCFSPKDTVAKYNQIIVEG